MSECNPFVYVGGPEHGQPILHPLDGAPLHEKEVLPSRIEHPDWTGAYVWNEQTGQYEWAEES